MKKFLLTAALVLALVTSLTAGTMAYYNTSVTMGTSNVNTKTFSFTADKTSTNFASGVTIAPGDTVQYELALKNASEVNTEATVEASLNKMFPGMSIKVELLDSSDSKESNVVASNDGKTSTSTVAMADTAIDHYMITVAWAYDTNEANDGAYTNIETAQYAGQKGDKAIVLTVNINGKQLADSAKENSHNAGKGGETITDKTKGTFN